eukprot:TRINITY_DN1492_c0_g1_i2.p1 TRINITY_DN1492_c0_g1~~TRINITY_DN1492_c0_g1_i2.p1  ORF type:complete len:306 (+),score=108.52 TRINITY_DN1492_c0_g1_i2:209-1126(+)
MDATAGEVVREGWLFKEGKFVKSYKRHYIKIVGKSLLFFENHNSATPIKTVSLHDYGHVEAQGVNADGARFRLVPEQSSRRKYSFLAPTKALGDDWMEAIKPRLHPNPKPRKHKKKKKEKKGEKEREREKIPLQLEDEFPDPQVNEKSSVLEKEDFYTLWKLLPPGSRLKDPFLLYSTQRDGYSSFTLIQKSKNHSPSILIVRSKTNQVFGAYVTEGWKEEGKGYFGDRGCFLFTLLPQAKKFTWTEGLSDFFMLYQQKALIVGGGKGYGLWLDGELEKGSSETCDTFLNPPLHSGSISFRMSCC